MFLVSTANSLVVLIKQLTVILFSVCSVSKQILINVVDYAVVNSPTSRATFEFLNAV